MFKLPSEVETLIKNILEFIGAEETNDKCVYSLESKDKDKDDTKEKDDKDDKDVKDDKDKDTNKDKDDNDTDGDDDKDSDDLL